MQLVRSAVLLSATLVLALSAENVFLSAQKWIDLINNDPNSTWKAGFNFDPKTPPAYIKMLESPKQSYPRVTLPEAPDTGIHDKDIPKEFDARKKWHFCKSLHTIHDEGNCDASWAISTTAAFTDRLCIVTKGKFNELLAAVHVLSCCYSCGSGCKSGDDGSAWKYFFNRGLVTGGDYGSEQGCQPFPFQPCEHHNVTGTRPDCSSLGKAETPPCESYKCTNKKYKKKMKSHRAAYVYELPPIAEPIQKDILAWGPVSARMDIYEDFIHYKSGVYQNTNRSSTWITAQVVKIIGWGVEDDLPYWLVQNCWNSDWGDHGLYKVLRGHNTAQIEEYIYAGMPDVNNFSIE